MMNNQFIYKKFTLAELLPATFAVTFAIFILYINYIINQQVSHLTHKIEALSRSASDLEKSNVVFKKKLLEKSRELEKTLVDLDAKQTTQMETIEFPVVSPEMLLAQNEMTQFYIKTGGVVLAGAVVVGLTLYLFPSLKIFFGAKYWLSSKVYRFIQDHTPFCQTVVEYRLKDNLTRTDWLVKLCNEKDVTLFVKPFADDSFVTMSKYVATLQSNSTGIGALPSSITNSLSSSAYHALISTVPESVSAVVATSCLYPKITQNTSLNSDAESAVGTTTELSQNSDAVSAVGTTTELVPSLPVESAVDTATELSQNSDAVPAVGTTTELVPSLPVEALNPSVETVQQITEFLGSLI